MTNNQFTIITFTNSCVHTVRNDVQLSIDGDTVFAFDGDQWEAYELFGIKSITPPKQGAPTKLQNQFTKVLQNIGYRWDKQHSAASAGVVLRRADGDFWFFGMEGEIMHNPDGITIKL